MLRSIRTIAEAVAVAVLVTIVVAGTDGEAGIVDGGLVGVMVELGAGVDGKTPPGEPVDPGRVGAPGGVDGGGVVGGGVVGGGVVGGGVVGGGVVGA